jgi:hypothetical protein
MALQALTTMQKLLNRDKVSFDVGRIFNRLVPCNEARLELCFLFALITPE